MKLGVILAAVTIAIVAGCAAPAGKPPADPAPATQSAGASALDGTWLAEDVENPRWKSLSVAWKSVFAVKNGGFSISNVYGDSTITGKITLNADHPNWINLRTDPWHIETVDYPASTSLGIYKLEGDRLTVCFHAGPGGDRPRDYVSKANNTMLLTLTRAPAGFAGLPKQVKVTVRDPAGRPAAGVSIITVVWLRLNREGQTIVPGSTWHPEEIGKTGPDGVATVAYDDLRMSPIFARDPARKWMGITPIRPASLLDGSAAVILQPQCHIRGTIRCPEMEQAGKLVGWTDAELIADGNRIENCESTSAGFEFFAPPGRYRLWIYGENVKDRRVDLVVPPGKAEWQAPPVDADSSRYAQLVGHPAPELRGVVAWRGQPVQLADLRGKYVALDFWGYWCGPCVGRMPQVIDLYNRYKDKGLAVIGVHVDQDGEIDTAAKLDEKIALFKEKFWHGQDLPFPVALTSMKSQDQATGDWRSACPAGDYGIEAYPSLLLIDPAGNLIGKKSPAEVEAILKSAPATRPADPPATQR